jgi:hypothetical protein
MRLAFYAKTIFPIEYHFALFLACKGKHQSRYWCRLRGVVLLRLGKTAGAFWGVIQKDGWSDSDEANDVVSLLSPQ